jgi:hypothetical protein
MRRLPAIVLALSVLGVAVHAVVFLFIPVQFPEPTGSRPQPTVAGFGGGLASALDPVLQERASLQDTAALFMPTRWSQASRMESVASLKQATEVFTVYPPVLSLAMDPIDPEAFGRVPTAIQINGLPSAELGLSRYGREDAPELSRRAAGPWMELTRFPGGTSRLITPPEDIIRLVMPPAFADQAPGDLWAPFEAHVHLLGGNLVGPPMLAGTSGYPDWDSALLAHLRSVAFHGQLPDGYYRILIKP